MLVGCSQVDYFGSFGSVIAVRFFVQLGSPHKYELKVGVDSVWLSSSPGCWLIGWFVMGG